MPSLFAPICHHNTLSIRPFLAKATHLPLLDVRSPSEFLQGHIPQAISFPLLSDEERAIVGTLYKQEGRDKALQEGYRLVQPKISDFLERIKALCNAHDTTEIALYCWRGGERSAAVANLFEEHNYTVHRLLNGYKSFRQFTLECFETPFNLHVISGKTGSGKTAILHQAEAQGMQIIDLEGMARHKGSAFGALPHEPQPSCEHFENRLAHKLWQLNPAIPTFLEDESQKLGRIRIPQAFFAQMKSAPSSCIETDDVTRTLRILEEYGSLPLEQLSSGIDRIKDRLGGERYKLATQLLAENNLPQLIKLLLVYYDKGYGHQAHHRDYSATIPFVSLEQTVMALAKNL